MEKLSILNQCPIFADIPQYQLEQLSQELKHFKFKRGDLVFNQGDRGKMLYIVRSGVFRIFLNSLSGQETSILLLGNPGFVFGEVAVIDDKVRSASVIALTNAELFGLSRESLFQFIPRSPALVNNIFQYLCSNLRQTNDFVCSLTSLEISKRLDQTLFQLAKDYGRKEEDGIYIDSLVTQDDLATFVGATRESVNKRMNELKQANLIKTKRHGFVILNMHALNEEIIS